MQSAESRTVILAGIPLHNPWLFRRAPFPVGDPVVFIDLAANGKPRETFLLLREIEHDRARAARIADHVHSPADFAPAGGLSGDRETAAAQAGAELLRARGVKEVWTDRSLPMIYADALQRAGITLRCDREMGVLERRSKTPREVEALRKAQKTTEECVRFACERIGGASAGAGGVLQADGAPLTSERVRSEICVWLLERGMEPCTDAIVACGPQGGDCHRRGDGALRTGQPVIIDIWPMDPASRYYGDCTRTVIHGELRTADPLIVEMHGAVVEAKRAAIGATRAGVTGEAVHAAARDVFKARGFTTGLPPKGATGKASATFAHGTGHGVGIDVHEPPLLDAGGPALVVGDCVTIEPGLYSYAVGGVRIEDMCIVREGGVENLNSLPEGLTWA